MTSPNPPPVLLRRLLGTCPAKGRSPRRYPHPDRLLALALAAALSLCPACLVVAAGGAGAAAGAAGSDPERNTGNVIADAYLTSAVKSALAAARGVRASDINVDTRKGVVTLRGTVRSAREATQAVEVARSMAGVKGVKSKLKVAGE